jgi:hypothetical protein
MEMGNAKGKTSSTMYLKSNYNGAETLIDEWQLR